MKKITAKEFRELGLLQEMNRQFLHPMGLALEVIIEADGNESFGGVWDSREDPRGITFADEILSPARANTVAAIFNEKSAVRKAKFGWHIQPIPGNEN